MVPLDAPTTSGNLKYVRTQTLLNIPILLFLLPHCVLLFIPNNAKIAISHENIFLDSSTFGLLIYFQICKPQFDTKHLLQSVSDLNMAVPPHTSNNTAETMEYIVSALAALSFLFIVPPILKNIVHEKEGGVKVENWRHFDFA